MYYYVKVKKVSRLSSVNKVNVVMWQDYQPIAKAIIFIEKMLITWYYPITDWISLFVCEGSNIYKKKINTKDYQLSFVMRDKRKD